MHLTALSKLSIGAFLRRPTNYGCGQLTLEAGTAYDHKIHIQIIAFADSRHSIL